MYKKVSSGSKYAKDILFNFEKGSTAAHVPTDSSYLVASYSQVALGVPNVYVDAVLL